MQTFNTKYGILEGLTSMELYENGNLKECNLSEPNKIMTPYGIFIPQYEDNGDRRKYIRSLKFYKNGTLKSLSLQEQTAIETRFGSLPAEFLTFYESGRLKRIFPLNGKITGFWTEENEYELSPIFEFNLPFCHFQKKVIGIQLYESGKVKSITFWPKDYIQVDTSLGTIDTRIGISLYANGNLKSIEPLKPTPIDTPIGKISAYNINAIGVHGDTNSLVFDEEGHVISLMTSSNSLEITNKDGKTITIKPNLIPSMFDPEALDLVPLTIEFFENKVRINQDTLKEFHYDTYQIQVKPFKHVLKGSCSDCSSCTACG
jgi:hypothetical protein